jgi:signal transduction histidine kinase
MDATATPPEPARAPLRRPGRGAWPARLQAALAHSLRARALAVFALLMLALTLVAAVGMQRMLAGGWQAAARPLLEDYADRLAAELGTPPDHDRAVAIAARLPVSVRVDGPAVQFDTHPGGGGDWAVERTSADGHRVRLGLATTLDLQAPARAGAVTVALLLLLVAAAAWAVARLMAPLPALAAGAARYAGGDFARRLVPRGGAELSMLAEDLNALGAALHRAHDGQRALLQSIAHELRRPLAPEQVREIVAALLEGERLAQGPAALQTAVVDVGALAREVIAKHFAGRGVELRVGDGVEPVRADRDRLAMMLRHLLDNALRHGASDRPPLIALRRAGDGTRLEIVVRDLGAGVDAPELRRLGEAFQRPPQTRSPGLGLGLYLCRRVAQAHGGGLALANATPGFEATVSIRSSSRP